jgi:hypothetical protein
VRRLLGRNVNESVAAVSRAFGDGVPMTILCECGGRGCDERVKITRADFEAARTAGHYVVAPWHRGGRLVRATDRFAIQALYA